MPLIWAAISAHGFGHAAQVVPVLNALGCLVPDLRVLLRTTVPAAFFVDRLKIPWEISPVQQDVGCVQQGPMTINIEATWREHSQFHSTWNERLQTEIESMRTAKPDLVLADTPYLALAAGKAASIPTIALASFTWDLILSEYQAPPWIDTQPILQSIRQAYRQADLALRITPSPVLDCFQHLHIIHPVAEPALAARAQLAEFLSLRPGHRTVLIGFGGIPLTSLPFEPVESLHGYQFLLDGSTPPESTRCTSIRSLPFSFKTLLASVDVVMTKPGYGTLVEAVALQVPIVYVRRYNFGDEQSLVEYLHRYGRGIELSMDDFMKGQWATTLERAINLPATTPPPEPNGASEAATMLVPYFKRNRS
jgi:UDP:flavonoid glycosyltransferase YjiC (YdhE family)